MRNCSVQDRYLDEVFLSILNAFCYCSGYFTGFSKPVTDDSVFISNDNDSRKTEGAPSFCNLCNSLYANKSVLELEIAGFNFSYSVSHNIRILNRLRGLHLPMILLYRDIDNRFCRKQHSRYLFPYIFQRVISQPV